MPKRALTILPRLDAEIGLEIVRATLKRAPAGYEKRLRFKVGDKVVIQLWTNHRAPNQNPDPAVEQLLFDAFNTHPRIASTGTRMPAGRTEELAEEQPPESALAGVATVLARALSNDGLDPFAAVSVGTQAALPLENELFAIARKASLPKAAGDLARVEWRSTGLRVGAADDGMVIAHLGVDPERGATQDIAARHADRFEPGTALYAPYKCTFGVLLLPLGCHLPLNLLDVASDLLALLIERELGAGPPRAVALDWTLVNGAVSAVTLTIATLPVAETISRGTGLGRDGTVHPVTVNRVDLAVDGNATATLRKLMEEKAGDIGYRLDLARAPSLDEIGDDLEDIQVQIEELEMRRALLLGESENDWRLLRFDATEISAMVDFLRRFPMAVIDAGHVRYAYHATMGSRAGVHFLLYRLRDVGREPAFPEAIWRRRTDGEAMLYGLDPLFARFHGSARVRSLVFVPRHHMLVPTLASIQPDEMDTYLRQGFGGLLGLADVFAGTNAGDVTQPLYLFGFNGRGEIRLEVLDRDRFQPIGRVVPFINDNLELSRRIEIEEFVTNIADLHWRQERLIELSEDNALMEARLAERMAAVDQSLAGQTAELLEALAAEVDAIRARMSGLLDFIDDLSRHGQSLEALAEGAIEANGKLDQFIEQIPDGLAEIDAIRARVLKAAIVEAETSRTFTGQAMSRLGSIRADISRIKSAFANDR